MEPTHCSALPLYSTSFALPELPRKNRSFKGNIDFVSSIIVPAHVMDNDLGGGGAGWRGWFGIFSF